MKTTSTFALALTLTACHFDAIGEASPESSSSSDDGTASTITVTTTSAGTTTQAESSSGSSSDESSSGSDPSETTDPTFGEDATTTGAPVTDWALAFDGGLGLSEPTNIVEFDGGAYTIELWLQVDADAEGVLFDTTVTVAGPNGVTLVRDPTWTESDALVFYDFGLTPPLRADGDDPSQWSPEWHHLALTNDGEAMRIWLDGSMVSETLVDQIANNAEAPIAIGSQPTTPFPPLTGVVVDEIRISRAAIYDAPFVPTDPLGDDGAALHWSFDEGDGAAYDSIVGMPMTFDAGVTWVAVD